MTSELIGMAEELDFEYFHYTGASCAFFLFMFNVVDPYVSEKYFVSYKSMSEAKKADWNSRINSSVHATAVALVCLYAILHDEGISKDPVWGHSTLVKTNCAVVIGYMIADTLILIQYWQENGEIFYIYHHMASIIAFSFVVTHGCLCWFANYRLIAEFSTPFVNQRWFLHELGYSKTSPVFILNGFAMALVFFFCRILSIPPYYSRVMSIVGTEASFKLGNIWFVLIGTCVVLDLINIFWMYKIVNGITKVLQEKFQEVAWKFQGKYAKAA